MAPIPRSATHGLPRRTLTHRPGDSLLALGVVTIAVTLAAGFAVPRGTRPAFHLPWLAFGMAASLGTVGIFSVGFAYLIAVALLVLALVATPNRSAIELRYDWRYVVGFHAGYLLMLAIILIWPGALIPCHAERSISAPGNDRSYEPRCFASLNMTPPARRAAVMERAPRTPPPPAPRRAASPPAPWSGPADWCPGSGRRRR